MVVRKVIKIDEDRCNGCGQCVSACFEGALEIVDGKAKVIKDSFCDGLGACIGECPEGALKIEEREVEEFDEEAVKEHMQESGIRLKTPAEIHAEHGHQEGHSCPSAKPITMERAHHALDEYAHEAESRLEHWPIQLMLIPETAPFLKGKNLMVLADCVAVAYPDLHNKFLSGNAVAMGCPKFDDCEIYAKKLRGIIQNSGIKSISVVNIEVPCCFGLLRLVETAVRESGKKIPFKQYVIGINGEIKSQR